VNPYPAESAFPIITGLPASAPHPDRQPGSDTFGQFIGTWDVDAEFFDESGRRSYQGRWEWSFAWILAGRAMQDVIVDLGPADEPRRGPLGTTLRYFDSRSAEWTVFWLGVVTGINVRLHGGMVADKIVLEGPDPDGTRNRWTFSDITADSFTWTGLESRDGVAWRLSQRMRAVRRGGH
jgi:hypothetical protein